MKKIILAFLVAFPALGLELRTDGLKSLHIEDKTGTGIFEIRFVASDGQEYFVDTFHTRDFILEQCLHAARTSIANAVPLKIIGTGSAKNLALYGCQLEQK